VAWPGGLAAGARTRWARLAGGCRSYLERTKAAHHPCARIAFAPGHKTGEVWVGGPVHRIASGSPIFPGSYRKSSII